MTTVDLVILIVVGVYAVIGLYRGLVQTVFHFVGGIVAFVGAGMLAKQFSAVVGEWFAPTVEKMVEKALPSLTGSVQGAQAGGEELWQSLSGYMQSLLTTSGVSADKIVGSSKPVAMLTKAITEQATQAVGYAAIFVVAFVAISLLINLAANMLDLVTRLPVLHSFNHVLGCLLGAGMGLLLCTCVLWTLKLFAPAVYSDVGILPPETMEQTVVARRLVGWNGGIALFESTEA